MFLFEIIGEVLRLKGIGLGRLLAATSLLFNIESVCVRKLTWLLFVLIIGKKVFRPWDGNLKCDGKVA